MRRALSVLLLVLTIPVFAAGPKTKKPQPGTDEFAIDSTVLAVYNVLSGPAGRRDWNRFKELFAPGGHIVAFRDGAAVVMTPDEFQTTAKPYFDENGAFRWPTESHVDRFKDIAHVTSRFETRHATTDAAPFERGVTYAELVRSGDRWLITSIVWQTE